MDASFERTRFAENTLFVESAFEDGAWFTDAALGAGAEFCRSEFRGSASFEGIQAGGSLRFSGAETGARMFGGAKCVVNLENMILLRPGEVSFSLVNIERISFFGTDLSKIIFEGVSWPEDKAGNLSFPGRIEAGSFEVRPGAASLTWLEGLCRQLRENFEARQNYTEAGEFRWAEMEYRRRRGLLRRQGEGIAGLRERAWARLLGLYRMLGGYGVRTGSAFKGLFIALVATIFLQGFLGVHHTASQSTLAGGFPCARSGGSTHFRRLGILEGEAGACSNAKAPLSEIFYHAGKFTLMSAGFQVPGDYEAATAAGRGLSPLMRVFFLLQLFLMFMDLRRRFGAFLKAKQKP